jgi:hypothetical protein
MIGDSRVWRPCRCQRGPSQAEAAKDTLKQSASRSRFRAGKVLAGKNCGWRGHRWRWARDRRRSRPLECGDLRRFSFFLSQCPVPTENARAVGELEKERRKIGVVPRSSETLRTALLSSEYRASSKFLRQALHAPAGNLFRIIFSDHDCFRVRVMAASFRTIAFRSLIASMTRLRHSLHHQNTWLSGVRNKKIPSIGLRRAWCRETPGSHARDPACASWSRQIVGRFDYRSECGDN